MKKRYPYRDKMKQIQLYLPKTTFKLIDKWKFTDETNAVFMRRAVANLIGQRIKLKEKGFLEDYELNGFLKGEEIDKIFGDKLTK